jgi:YhcH/YjgK/YiaL family protein
MIVDSFANHVLYGSVHPLFSKAFAFAQSHDLNKLELGKHIIDGDDLFVIVMEYETKDEKDCLKENHIKYIDIQFMVKGEELMGVSLLNGQMPTTPYDEARDAAFYKNDYESLVKVCAGEFAIFFPHDLHMPSIRVAEKQFVRKAVFKVSVK